MAKSTGNIARVGDLLATGVSPRALRYALLSVHYRARLDYSDESLAAAGAAVARLDAAAAALEAYREERADDPGAADGAGRRAGGLRGRPRRRPQHLGRAGRGLRPRARAQPPDRGAVPVDRRCGGGPGDPARSRSGPWRPARSRPTPSTRRPLAMLEARAAARAARDWAARIGCATSSRIGGSRSRTPATASAGDASWRAVVADRPRRDDRPPKPGRRWGRARVGRWARTGRPARPGQRAASTDRSWTRSGTRAWAAPAVGSARITTGPRRAVRPATTAGRAAASGATGPWRTRPPARWPPAGRRRDPVRRRVRRDPVGSAPPVRPRAHLGRAAIAPPAHGRMAHDRGHPAAAPGTTVAARPETDRGMARRVGRSSAGRPVRPTDVRARTAPPARTALPVRPRPGRPGPGPGRPPGRWGPAGPGHGRPVGPPAAAVVRPARPAAARRPGRRRGADRRPPTRRGGVRRAPPGASAAGRPAATAGAREARAPRDEPADPDHRARGRHAHGARRASTVTRAWRSSSSRVATRRSRRSWPGPRSEGRRPSSSRWIRSRIRRTSARSCAAPRRPASTASCSRPIARRR